MKTAAGVGLSSEPEPVAAARQAARIALEQSGADRADWAVVFATGPYRPHYSALLAAVQGVLRTVSLAGCSAWGVLTGKEEVEGRPAVAVLAVRSDRIAGTTLLVPIGEDQGPAAATEIGRRIAGGDRGGGDRDSGIRAGGDRPAGDGRRNLLVLLPDPLALRPDLFLGALARAVPGEPAIGGAASGDPKIEGTFQFYGRNVATRSVAAVHLSGELEVSLGITQGCQPLGKPCRITRGRSNLILELDGRPALDVLRSRLPRPLRDSLERLAGHLFVGLPPDPDQTLIEPGEYLVRNLLGADSERGALAIGATIKEGQPILLALREGQSARDDLKQMLARLSTAPARPRYRFGFYFNCAARGRSLYGMPGIDSAYISAAFGDLPIIGFFGNAEIAPLRGANHLFTHTGVLALVAERQ